MEQSPPQTTIQPEPQAQSPQVLNQDTNANPEPQQQSLIDIDINLKRQTQEVTQLKVNFGVINQRRSSVDSTKRSDDYQFVNWEISTVKSGKFNFIQRKQSIQKVGTLELVALTIEEKQQKVPQNKNKRQLKVMKTNSYHKTAIKTFQQQQFKSYLLNNKLLKIIFNHFCKQTNLVSIKSTLFEQKQKKMEEMSLNKWMVFCKQFDIYSKLFKLKNASLQSQKVSPKIPLQNSQVRETYKIKEAKEIEKTLIIIFRKANKNGTKMNFTSFIQGVILIYNQCDPVYPKQEKAVTEFLHEVMHCAQQRSCYKKLSCLKLTTATPQIQYQKVSFPIGQIKSRVKSRLSKQKQKQNSKDVTLQSINKSKSLAPNQFSKLHLNSIIRQAKNILKQNESVHSKNTLKYNKNTAKLVLKEKQQQKQKEKQNSDKQLIKYFESTKDPILDTYFQFQNTKKLPKAVKH